MERRGRPRFLLRLNDNRSPDYRKSHHAENYHAKRRPPFQEAAVRKFEEVGQKPLSMKD
jgi:hypothetical protein